MSAKVGVQTRGHTHPHLCLSFPVTYGVDWALEEESRRELRKRSVGTVDTFLSFCSDDLSISSFYAAADIATSFLHVGRSSSPATSIFEKKKKRDEKRKKEKKEEINVISFQIPLI
jgi:hypothetical protein